MDLNSTQNRSRKGYPSVNFSRAFRSTATRGFSSTFTIQFFLALPLRLSISSFLSPLLRSRIERPQQMARNSNEGDTCLTERALIAENRLYSTLEKFVDVFNGQQFISQLKLLACEQPVVLLSLAVIGCVAAFPMLIFVCITAISMVLTAFGFIVFQGTLLTVAAILMGGSMIVAAFLALPLTVFLGVAYLSSAFVAHAYSSAFKLGQRMVSQGSALRRAERKSVIGGPLTKSGRSLVPICVLESDLILYRRLAANGGSSSLNRKLWDSAQNEALIEEPEISDSR